MLKPESIAQGLVPLPKQPADLPWPTTRWLTTEPVSSNPELFAHHTNAIFDLAEAQGVTYALLIVKEGRLIYERYQAGADRFYLQYSWSMAKSVTHALVGILVRDGRINIYDSAPVEEWQKEGDPRRDITLDQLLRMSSGLEFIEDYVDGGVSDVIAMLNFDGRHDMAKFAAEKPLIHTPGSVWSYSSGTTNIICRILKNVIDEGPTGMLSFMREELFEPLGIRSPTPRFDTSGTFIGSSFLFATPRDFVRFGYFYLRDGVWERKRILPEGWVDYGRSSTYQDDEQAYGAHWWLTPGKNWFFASGYDGQLIGIIPEKDVIIVRCGRTPEDQFPQVREKIHGLAEAL